MKHSNTIRTMAALLIASMAFVSCNKESEPATGTFTMTINAAKGDNTSKALSLDGTTLTAAWAQGESVTVYNATRNTDLQGSLVAQSDGANTVLKGTLSGTIAQGDVLTLKFLNPDYSTQEGTLEYIATHCDYAEATVTVASVSNGNITTTSDANFENQQAIVKFTLKNSDGTETLSITQFEFVVNNNSYTVTPTSATDELYIAIPGFSGQDITIIATDGVSNYHFTKPNVTFTTGQYYTIAVQTKLVSVTWTDLDDYGTGGIDMTSLPQSLDINGKININLRRSGTTFSSTVGSISKIEITCASINFTAPSGWSWDSDSHKLIWNGTPSDEVRLSTGQASNITDVSSIEFTLAN